MAVSVSELQSPFVPPTLVWYCAPKWSGRHHRYVRVMSREVSGCGVVGLQRLWDMFCVRRTAKWTGLDWTGLDCC